LYTWTNSHLIRELLGMSILEEGAVGAVGEKSLQEKKLSNLKVGEMSQAETSEKKEW
jgi:hypothetical protein